MFLSNIRSITPLLIAATFAITAAPVQAVDTNVMGRCEVPLFDSRVVISPTNDGDTYFYRYLSELYNDESTDPRYKGFTFDDGSAKVTLIKSPKHGKVDHIKSRVSKHYYHYNSNKGYSGDDRFVMQVEKNGTKVLILYLIKVPAEDESPKYLCRQGTWKIWPRSSALDNASLQNLLTTTTYSASFDCAKAATKVEKIICGDIEIAKLDEELSFAYKRAKKIEKCSAEIKSSQQQWLKQRNACSDGACVRRIYLERLERLAYEDQLKDSPSKPCLIQYDRDNALLEAVHTKNKAEVERLLAMGADPNNTMVYYSQPLDEVTPDDVKWADSSSLLHAAIRLGNAAIVDLLLKYGADINSTSGNGGDTPLHLAVQSGNREIVELLLAKGANINVGVRTPLFYAANERNKEMVALLIAKGADINANKGKGDTPFHGAVYGGSTEIMEMMIAKGADVHVRGNYGRTALLLAVENANRQKNAIELLLSKEIDVNAPDHGLQTPLHWAAFSDNVELIKLLLAKGANINAKNKDGLSPLEFAIKHNKKESIKFLSTKLQK